MRFAINLPSHCNQLAAHADYLRVHRALVPQFSYYGYLRVPQVRTSEGLWLVRRNSFLLNLGGCHWLCMYSVASISCSLHSHQLRLAIRVLRCNSRRLLQMQRSQTDATPRCAVCGEHGFAGASRLLGDLAGPVPQDPGFGTLQTEAVSDLRQIMGRWQGVAVLHAVHLGIPEGLCLGLLA